MRETRTVTAACCAGALILALGGGSVWAEGTGDSTTQPANTAEVRGGIVEVESKPQADDTKSSGGTVMEGNCLTKEQKQALFDKSNGKNGGERVTAHGLGHIPVVGKLLSLFYQADKSAEKFDEHDRWMNTRECGPGESPSPASSLK